MTELKKIKDMPDGGWLVDLDKDELKSLVGATLNVFCGARSNTGLVTKIEDGIAYLYRPDQAEPLQYAVNGTKFERTPGTPMRPALARALDYKREWTELSDSMADGAGNIAAQQEWDHARGDYEYGMPDVFESLLTELTNQLFPTRPTTHLNAPKDA